MWRWAQEQELLIKELDQALLAREFEKLDTAVQKCKEFGITGKRLVIASACAVVCILGRLISFAGTNLNEALTMLEKLRCSPTALAALALHCEPWHRGP